jgi:hypothetical protein
LAGRRRNPDDGSNPPQAAIAVLVALVFGLPVLAAALHFFGIDWRSFLPYGDSENWYIVAIFAPLPLLVVVAVITKLWEARRASRWTTVAGRIVKSKAEPRHHQFAGEAATVTSVPSVEYEFTIAGHNYRGARISIGDDAGGANIEATLARYPVGKIVTVYYDPADPNSCVLERDVPAGLAPGCLGMSLAAAVAIIAIYLAATNATRLAAGYLPRGANPEATVGFASFGLVVLAFFVLFRRYIHRASSWPSVPGKVAVSRVESYVTREEGREVTRYSPQVEYVYAVRGVEYRSRQIRLGMTLEGSEEFARSEAARYPEGSDIVVHYDPENASNAALESPGGYPWLLLAVAALCFGVAIYTSAIFRG